MDKDGLSTILLIGFLGVLSGVALIYMNVNEFSSILESITKHYFFQLGRG